MRVWDRRDGICLVGVEWDRPIHGGHSCDGSAISGRGWNVYERELRLVAPESDDTDLCIDESALFSSILA